MITHFGTLFFTWHIYHYLTIDVSRGTPVSTGQHRHSWRRGFTWNKVK